MAEQFRGKAVTIACTNRRASERFYEEVLGARILPGDYQGACPSYQLGSLVLTLMPSAIERSPAVMPTHAMAMLWLEVDDLQAAFERCVRFGVEVIEPPHAEPLFMLIADPDGIVIEVWQREKSDNDR